MHSKLTLEIVFTNVNLSWRGLNVPTGKQLMVCVIY